MTDFAKRAYDHAYHIDPIVRSLLDTDFYKLLMLQFIWRNYFNHDVTFSVTNRTKTVRLADDIDLDELRAQLDHVRTLSFTPNELIWLAGNTFYGQDRIFGKGFLDYLRNGFRLSDYRIDLERDESQVPPDHGGYPLTGQIVLTFSGPWVETTMWEIYALTIINELRYRAYMKKMKRSTLDIMYARAKVKLYDKLEALNEFCPELNLTDFGTRRRHSFLWQEHCVLTAREVLGDKFTGTSNCYLAMKHGLEAKGTNAHELPMVLAAIAKDDDALKASQYEVLRKWQEDYRGALLVMLPDTFGTTQFLADAPEWVRLWTGARPDSKKPIPAGEELIAWWKDRNEKPEDKLIIFSDGLDVDVEAARDEVVSDNDSDIISIYEHFHGRVRLGFGWGTNLTNDFLDCVPGDGERMKPISLVCKVAAADGRPAVKLSDNFTKATGPAAEVERYRRVFGTAGQAGAPVRV